MITCIVFWASKKDFLKKSRCSNKIQWNFFSPIWDCGHGPFNALGKIATKQENIHATTFSLNWLCFVCLSTTVNFNRLFMNSQKERWYLKIVWFDLCFIGFFFFTLYHIYLLLWNLRLESSIKKVNMRYLLPEDMIVDKMYVKFLQLPYFSFY